MLVKATCLCPVSIIEIFGLNQYFFLGSLVLVFHTGSVTLNGMIFAKYEGFVCVFMCVIIALKNVTVREGIEFLLHGMRYCHIVER